MKHSVPHIGAPDGQNRLLHAVITFGFQWQIKATPGNTDELTCLAFRKARQTSGSGPPTFGLGPSVVIFAQLHPCFYQQALTRNSLDQRLIL